MSTLQLTRASNLHRRVRCPGSGWAEHGLEEADSEYSAEGTRLHEALHNEETREGVTEKQQDLVKLADELRREGIEKAGVAFAIPADATFTEGWEREVTVRKGIRPILTGHIDYWRHYPEQELAIIFDAKFGFLETTPAPLNLQLLAYALGAWQEFGVKHVAVAIGQPRAMLEEAGSRLSIARYDVDDLAAALQTLLAWEAAWKVADAPRSPSEDACRYCKAKLTCDPFMARMVDLPALSIEALPSLAAMPEADFARLYLGWRIATNEKVTDAIKAEARARCAEGRLPGFRLEEGNTRRTITDQVEAFDLLTTTGGLTARDYAEAAKVSLGGLEKVVRTKSGVKAKEAKEFVNATLATVLKEEQSAPSLVPIDPEKEAQRALR